MVLQSARRAPKFAARGQILTPLLDGGVGYWRDGMLLTDADGRIAFVGDAKTGRRRYRGPLRDYRGQLLLPGFVDAHLHFPQTRIIGAASGPLLTWLQQSVFPEEARFRNSRYAREVAKSFIGRMLAAGTTTAGIFSSSSARATDVLFEQLDAHGMRAATGITLMDRRAPAALLVKRDAAIRACRRLIKRWHGSDDDRLRFAVTPRFALSCSRALLRDAGKLAHEHELLVQTHIGETRDEGTATLKAHRYAKDYLDVYDQAGLLGPRTLLAHAIHLSATEWRRLKQAGASVAHCPDSNFFLGSGRMPLRRAQKHARALALGSDIAAGRSFSMRRAMAHAYDNAQCLGIDVTPAALLRMATLGGAQALHWGDRVGSLEVGKDADVVVIAIANAARDAQHALSALLFDTDDTGVVAAFVRGQRVYAAASS